MEILFVLFGLPILCFAGLIWLGYRINAAAMERLAGAVGVA